MKIIKCDYTSGFDMHCEEAVAAAAEDLSAGKLVVYPTETVYGIGADIYNQAAVKNLYVTKNRPFDMPLSVAVSDKAMLESVAVLNENADKLIKAFLPGPLTIIIKKQPDVPDIVTSSSQKVGIRIPDDRFALELIRRTGPIVATSANLHSKPDSVDVNAAINDFGDSVDTYIDAGPCSLGQPSTIVWLMDKEVEIIRQGAISVEKIKEVLEC
ncbi:MAG: threonylcarbamoyl-AMP synthase [Candidatus Methanomethylophilaceae archaeon]|nr:threonylcarbamoyl-AMP synthase [Candidatus Methanomethylophilaceae archaeon]MBQ7405820.1 threonylcarbamoyl-AMP synthase [Candidatus Methanomethylophilaceae archaeon]MBQ8644273.1 threonylcarbamoyl-AMP synthase [Candidatus Methanomethylophilaceae archaeon]MBR1973979.1 threonylcarbamoyl-AMP synthase [Candidatus Methanomethylophilaceae archaeon]